MLAFGYYPVLFLTLFVGVTILYRVSLPKPLPSHRLVLGSVLATVVFLLATLGLRVYLTWITSTGYTYGALATPIAFLLFAFFLGFAIMMGAELNAAIEEEWPAPATHARRFRSWLEDKAESLNGGDEPSDAKQKAPRLTRPLVRRASRGLRTPTALLLELLVDPLAVGADRRAGFGGLRHREHLAAQRDDVRAHHRALGDLVLLDVVEELRGVAVGPVVDAFVGVGAFDRLGSHVTHFARKKSDTYSGRRVWNSGDMKQSPELSFDDDGRPVLITRAAPSYEVQHRERVRKYLTLMFWRIPALILAAVAYGIWENGLDLAGDPGGIGPAAVDRRAHRQRPSAASCRGAAALRVGTPNSAVSDGRTARPGVSRALVAAIGRKASRRAMFPAEEFLAQFSAHSQVERG